MPSVPQGSSTTLETDTDMNTMTSDNTDHDDGDVNNNTVFTTTALNHMIGRNSNTRETGLPFVQPNICRRGSSSLVTPKQSQFFQSFQFATGVVCFSWLVYFIWQFMYPIDLQYAELDPECLLYQFSQLPLHSYLLIAFIISIIATAIITAVSMGLFKLFGNLLATESYQFSHYPKLYTPSDPGQRDLSHSEILEESKHGSMRPQTPYNFTLDSKRIFDARAVHKNTESGMPFIDGFYRQRVRKFKKTLQHQQEMLEKIRKKHQKLNEKNIPQYMLCSPCYDPYTCNRIHFDYNGYRYHCQPHDEDFGESRRKMSQVKIYKDNVLGKPFRNEVKSKDLSAPNDYPGRNLHSILAQKFPPFTNDFDMSRPETTLRNLNLSPTPRNPFRKACPRKDPCIYCRDNEIRLTEHTEVEADDYNGNQTVTDPSGHEDSRIDNGNGSNVEESLPPPPSIKHLSIGPNVLYVNYNFDYQ